MDKEEKKTYMKEYRLKNKEKIKTQTKKYREEHLDKIKEYAKKYRQKNKEKLKDLNKTWSQENREHVKEYRKDYYNNTPNGRAQMLCQGYKRNDREAGREGYNLTPKWIMTYIFSQPCAHCGRTGWDVIGCNRLDNSKAHTIDNVEPCCGECNVKLPRNTTPVDQIDPITGEVIKTWPNPAAAEEEGGFSQTSIRMCSNGGRYLHGKWINCHTYKGYVWRFHA
jgi:ABC-type proline/glycine betaine transport system substrate-binding protein